MAGMAGACGHILEAVGETPIVELRRLAPGLGHRLYAKCEFMNPGGSVKDRIAMRLVQGAEARGELRPGGTIVEATAGNTGAALAMVAALRDYGFVCVTTDKVSCDKLQVMRAFGARVVVCPARFPAGHPEHFMAVARRLAADLAGAWYADQFHNADNVAAHAATTGPEIWRQTRGEIDVLVAGIGTGGTLHGVGQYLRSQQSDLEIIAADPEGSILAAAHTGSPQVAAPYLVEGIGGDFVPGCARLDLVDAVETVPDHQAVATALLLLRREGILVGLSSGCALAAALTYARRLRKPAKNILVMLTDGGRNYLSTLYNPAWRRAHGVDFIFPTALSASDWRDRGDRGSEPKTKVADAELGISEATTH